MNRVKTASDWSAFWKPASGNCKPAKVNNTSSIIKEGEMLCVQSRSHKNYKGPLKLKGYYKKC